jgi:hypothetical protein
MNDPGIIPVHEDEPYARTRPLVFDATASRVSVREA